ncbi:MAG: S-layer homology domain-containing protein [Candidatus Eisenbacteria bacterium]|nr:S-layer homology domain-containing protein [Candidatus Eisenbacteria bacterium]
MTKFAAVLAATFLLATAWQGCASRNAARVPGSDKRLDFSQRYDVVTYLVSTGKFQQAASQLKKLEQEAKSGVERAMVSDAKASLHLARGEVVSAEEDASRAIGIYPSLASAYKVRALARREQGELSGVVEDLKSALALEPNDTESLRGLAEAYLDQNEIFEAVRTFERFLQVDSLDARAQDAWRGSMASLLGLDSFPIEYLRTLRSSALTRGELAAVLVVEFETARLEQEWRARPDTRSGSLPSGSESPSTLGNVSPQASVRIPDCAHFWFAPFAEKAVSLGFLDVYPDNTFRPLDTVRRGVLALELYSFLERHCENALSGVQDTLGEPVRGVGGRVLQASGLSSALTSVYSDVDASSYLWRPVVAMAALGVVRPASRDSFGIDSLLSGEETRAIARNLAAVMGSNKCEATY